jgi:hypothetical protein
MLFCLPLFDIHTYPEWIGAAASLSEGGLKMIHNLLVVNGASSAGFYDAVNDY